MCVSGKGQCIALVALFRVSKCVCYREGQSSVTMLQSGQKDTKDGAGPASRKNKNKEAQAQTNTLSIFATTVVVLLAGWIENCH